MRHSIRLITILAAAGSLACLDVHAQTARSGGGGEAQKFMQQYQQVAAEKTSLQNQLAQMKKDLDAAKADLAAVKKERDGLKSRTGGSSAAFAQANAAKLAAEQSLEQSKQKISDLVSKYRELAQNLKDVEADKTAARKESAERVVRSIPVPTAICSSTKSPRTSLSAMRASVCSPRPALRSRSRG